MDTNNLIFVGFELTAELHEKFAACQDRNRAYLEDSAYLEIVEIDGVKYVGKRAESAIAIDRIEDIARSVVSLLARVCEDWTLGPSEAIVLGAEEEETTALSEEQEESKPFDYSGLVD